MYELIVIGGGPAGLAAACAAWDSGLRRILIVERDRELGGILNQCIHNGFGLHHFKEELTGPEYAGRFVELLKQTGVEVRLDTMVLEVTPDRKVHMVGKTTGYRVEEAESIVLAMGCRERTRGAIAIPGTRPAGVFTAGAAQRYVNMEGWLPGKRVVILGSGDIGLIMARRMTLEGAKVLACVELMPTSGGLNRNIVQCLQDYDIPLYLSHTVTDIRGKDRVEQVVVSQVDEKRDPIPGTEMVFDCDTLLLSVGLIPENEVAKSAGVALDGRGGGALTDEFLQTGVPGIFACGNCRGVMDLVDFVTDQGARAGQNAAAYCRGEPLRPWRAAKHTPRKGVPEAGTLSCILCPNGCQLRWEADGSVTGNRCPRGAEYGRAERTAPTRVVTSTVRVSGGLYPRCPVKTDKPIPKEKVMAVLAALEEVSLTAPVRLGQVVVRNVCGTGADVVTARALRKE